MSKCLDQKGKHVCIGIYTLSLFQEQTRLFRQRADYTEIEKIETFFEL